MDGIVHEYRKILSRYVGVSQQAMSEDKLILEGLNAKIAEVQKLQLFLSTSAGAASNNNNNNADLTTRVQTFSAGVTKNLETQRQQLKQKLKEVTAQLSTKKQQANGLKSGLDSATSELKQLKINLNSMNQNIERNSEQSKKTDLRILNMREELKSLMAQKIILEQERERHLGRIRDLEGEVADKSKKSQEQKKQIVSLEHRVADSAADIANKAKQLADYACEIADNKLIIAEMEERYNKLEAKRAKQNRTMNEELNNLNKQLHSAKINHDAQLLTLEQEKHRLLGELQQRKQEQITNLIKEKEEQKNSYERQLKQLKDEREAELRTLNSRRDRAERDITNQYENKINKLIVDYDAKIKHHLDTIEQKVQISSKLQEELQQQIAKVKLEAKEFKDKNQVLSERVIGLLEIKDQKIETIQKMTETIKDLEERLAKHIEDSAYELSTVKAEAKSTKQTMEKDFEVRQRKLKDTIRRMENQQKQAIVKMEIRLHDQKEYEVSVQKNKLVELQKKSAETEERLRDRYGILEEQYVSLKSVYDQKFDNANQEYKAFVNALNERHNYEIEVNAEKKEREKQNLINKYEIKINAQQKDFANQKTQLAMKMEEQRTSALAKLKNAYEEEIQILKRESALEIRQRAQESDRKVKMLEKKIVDQQNNVQKLQRKLADAKEQAQRRIDSLTQLHYLDSKEVEKAQQQVEYAEIQKEQLRNQLQNTISRLETEMVELKEIYHHKEQHLIESCNHRIAQNIQEMKTFTDKLNAQLHELQEKHQYAQALSKKEQRELEYLYEKRPSRPEDVEALKLMHQAYLDLKQEIQNQKALVVELKKQLSFREATNKIINVKQLEQAHTVRLSNGEMPFSKRKLQQL